MLTLVSPATSADLAQCAPRAGGRQWALLQAQAGAGPSFALRRADGEAVFCGGFADLEEIGTAEAWFMPSAAGHARKHMVAIIRVIALTLMRQNYRAVRTVVETDAGRRIARLAGFRPFDAHEGLEVWIWLA